MTYGLERGNMALPWSAGPHGGGKFQTAHTKEASTMTIQTNTNDRKALAKAIAEEHNGYVRAYNKPEGGARFIITLPIITPKMQLSHRNNEG